MSLHVQSCSSKLNCADQGSFSAPESSQVGRGQVNQEGPCATVSVLVRVSVVGRRKGDAHRSGGSAHFFFGAAVCGEGGGGAMRMMPCLKAMLDMKAGTHAISAPKFQLTFFVGAFFALGAAACTYEKGSASALLISRTPSPFPSHRYFPRARHIPPSLYATSHLGLGGGLGLGCCLRLCRGLGLSGGLGLGGSLGLGRHLGLGGGLGLGSSRLGLGGGLGLSCGGLGLGSRSLGLGSSGLGLGRGLGLGGGGLGRGLLGGGRLGLGGLRGVTAYL